MSQTNPPGEEDDGNRDPVSEEFEFYFPFAKTLALDLPTPEGTSIAAAWVQKLEAEPESDAEKLTRLNYLKLLLFVLQRGRLSGIFRKQPPSGALQPFPQGLTVLDMGNLMLDQDDSPTCGEGDARCLPYNTEISNDLREFVASQEIPDFGVQMYYAWSFDEPVHKWLGFDEEKFPQFVLDKIKQLKEVKSDERSTTVKNGCIGPKTGCDLTLIDKTTKKKVKSPQEIEKSQGRSFHTYVGLVGRMGNFNDKCGDDQDKCPRQDSRKVKCARRNLMKQFPGGEVEDFEDDVSAFLAGGLNSINRPCLCPMMGGPHFPEHCGKATPQQFQEQQSPRMNYTFTLGDRNQPENAQWNSPDSECSPPEPRQYNDDQCLEPPAPQQLQHTPRRSPSPRPKSSQNRPTQNFDCPLQDDGGFYKREAVCCCTSPPCTCPCPRSVPSKKAPSSANAQTGGRVPGDPSSACMRPGAGGYRMNREDPCAGAPQGPSSAPSGAVRPGSSPRPPTRNKSPQVIHCYDGEAPDPNLTVSKIDTMSWSEEGDCSPFAEDLIKDYFASEKSPGFQRLSSPQREGYDPCQQQQQQQPKAHATTCPASSGMKQKSDRSSPLGGQRPRTPTSTRSGRSPSPAPPRPVRQVQQDSSPVCRPNQQYIQNYLEFAKSPSPRPGFGNVCGGSADTSIQSNQTEHRYSFLDKFPPECGFTPAPYENVFRRPAPEGWSPESPNWNQPENVYEFLDKSSFNTSGLTGLSEFLSDDECFRSTTDSSQTPSGIIPEDIYSFIEKRFPGNPPAAAPSAMAGRPSSRQRPGMNDVCGRPSPEPCPQQSQTGNQPEDLYAFLERNFPPRPPPNSPQNKKSARIANVNSLLQGINLRREAHREKCDQAAPRKSPALDATYCIPHVCPDQSFSTGGAMVPNYGGECRTPKGPVCQDTGACRRQPATAPANMDRSQSNRACANLPSSCQGKNATFVVQQPLSSRQPMGGAYGGGGQAACEAEEEEEDECESSESVADVCAKESVPMYVLPCPPQRAQGRTPQQAQGPSRSVQQCPSGWPGMQGGATPRPATGRTGRNEPPRPNEADMRSCAPQRATPGKTPQPEQCTYRVGEVQSIAPKRIAPGKTCEQEKIVYREPSVRPTSPRKVIPEGHSEGCEEMPSGMPQMRPQGHIKEVSISKKYPPEGYNGAFDQMPGGMPQMQPQGYVKEVPISKKHPLEGYSEAFDQVPSGMPQMQPQGYVKEVPISKKYPSEGYNEVFAQMPSGMPQTQQQGYGNEMPVNKELTVQISSHRKKSSGKPFEEKMDEGWVIMRPSPGSRQGYNYETGLSKEAEKQVCSPGKPLSPGKVSLQDTASTQYLEIQVKPTPEPNITRESNVTPVPNTWVSFKAREESPRPGIPQSQEPDIQSRQPQNLPPGKPLRPSPSTEEWSEFRSGYIESASSRGSNRDDEPPTWQTFEYRKKMPPPEGPVPKEPNIPAPPQRKSLGKSGSQEPGQSYPQAASASRRTSPRPQQSQNKLSRQKSSSRTYQSVTDTKSKSVRKSNSGPSKSGTRSSLKIASAAKIEPKPKPRIKSDTQMNVKSDTQMKLKSQKQTGIKSEIKIQIRPNLTQKTKCVLKDLTYDNTRRISQPIPQQMPCMEQEGILYCCNEIENVVHHCAEHTAPNYRGNPYVEKSMAYHKNSGPPLIRNSSPIENEAADPRNAIPNVTSICQYNSMYDYTTSNQQTQTEFVENQSDNSEYMPLYSQNADMSAGKFFNLPQMAPQNDHRPQQACAFNCPRDSPRNVSQGLPFQSCQDATASVVYCDNPDSGYYRVYYPD